MATETRIGTCRTVDDYATSDNDNCGCTSAANGSSGSQSSNRFDARTESYEEPRRGNMFSDLREVPALLRKLGSDVTLFVDQKVALLKAEVRNEAKAYLRDGVMLAIGAVLLTVAFLIVNISLGFFIARLFPFSLPVAYGLGFLILGLVYVAAGGLMLRKGMKDLGLRHLKPEKTVEELKRDKQWVQNELT